MIEQILVPNDVIKIATENGKKYSKMTYDGHFFYFTLPKENKISKFNQECILTTCYDLNRPYSSICYDKTEECFWAWDERTNYTIYKLNMNLEEIGYIELCKCAANNSKITGLSYNCEKDTIFISFSNSIAEFSKTGQLIKPLQKTNNSCCILSIFPYYIIIEICEHTQIINIYSLKGKRIKSYCFSSQYEMKDIVFNPCLENEKNTISLIFFAFDNCGCPCILKCKIELCGKDSCPCNFQCCHNCCDSVCDLLESIALMETALSHVLNAEGEKIQKAIKLADNVCDLLEIDKAVNRTITNITSLEQTLYAKLESVNNINLENCHKIKK